jgi:hypothetical protein
MRIITLLLAGACVLASSPAFAQLRGAKPDRIRIAYVPPTNPEHQPLYAMFKQRQVLEKFREFLSPIKLPEPLTLKIEGCEGVSNAWYEPGDRAVTVCYEYMADVQKNAPKETTPGGVTHEAAVVGPTVEVVLHEVGHAIFDMLKVPILGREEDAADLFAAFVMLQFGKQEARTLISGIAYMYAQEAMAKTPGPAQFANAHGLPAQRLYNALCIAYGHDKELFSDIATKGYLPPERAEGCEEEYQQLRHAIQKLIAPHIDKRKARQVAARKWLR